jgi:SNF2 family DNA or RNA helicase
MIVLHAGVCEDRFLLWGETPMDSQSASNKRSQEKKKTDTTTVLPFDAGSQKLKAALKEAGISLSAKRAETGKVWLPTRGKHPLASSSLIAEPPASKAKVKLAPWLVTVFCLTAAEIAELLCSCQDKHILVPGIIVGTDLAFWGQALRLAGSLTARQQFLPRVLEDEGNYYACWLPVLSAADNQRLTDLAKSMPAVARAFSATDSPPEISSVAVLESFISRMTDHLVRTSYSASPLSKTSLREKKKSADFDSVHDQWLHALLSPEGIMEGDRAELADFYTQAYQWQRPIMVSAASPFRLCFRLEEPEDGKDTDDEAAFSITPPDNDLWHVRYLLQDTADPSLLIPAEDAWQGKKNETSLFRQREVDVKEYLLSSFGQAAGICRKIEQSLKTSQPSGYELDAAGAHQFLTEKALELEQAGFGVLLPAWWTRKGTKLQLHARAEVKSPKMQGGGELSLTQIIKFNWEVALGEEKLTLAELQALAKLKSPLIKVRGQWVEMTAEEIQAALEFWKSREEKSATVRDIIKMAVGARGAVHGIPLSGVQSSGWIDELLSRLKGETSFTELPEPDKFCGNLRPYQLRGYSWLAFLKQWGLGACLADDMGLGKTIQTLALIQRDWHEAGRRPVLLVCPTSVMNNWQKEAARFTPELPVMVHHGITRKKGAAFRKIVGKCALVITSYALLHRDIGHLGEISWNGVILDEAQNIKNPETKQAKAARSLKADYRITLTGTPVENNVGDLWSIMEFLNPGFLGSQAEFKRSFFVPIQAGRDPQAAGRLKNITGPFILRRLKTDKSIISDLPEKMEMKVFCNLTKEQASLYTAVVKDMEESFSSSEGIQRKGLILAALSKLKQVCNHPAQFLGDNSKIPGRSGKLARLTEMLEEIMEVGDRALIFSQFSEMGEIARKYLQDTFGREVLFLHGGVTRKRRDEMVERFQNEDHGPRLFILSLKAGGTGLNLTRANHVFHFDRWWNPAVENQATDRAFRIGQTKDVQVHKFICAGTLEEKIDEMIESKKEIADKVVGTGEGWLTELSDKELKELFTLSKEAVG